MKSPRPRGEEIDANRMENWVHEFSGYRHNVTESRIDRWLKQFDAAHKDLAARVLDCVDYIPQEQVGGAFRSLLNSISGWNLNESDRQGKWRFVSFSSSAGKSGDSMLYQFRIANGLAAPKHDTLFIHMRDLLRENLGSEDTVVFVDDFAGTGDQVRDTWSQEVQELLPGGPRAYLVLVAASRSARDAIAQATGLTVNFSVDLAEADDIFGNECSHFDAREKEAILAYCKKADKHSPRGYGECGFVIVFAHRCPNNSIPILHVDHDRWRGLFRRYH